MSAGNPGTITQKTLETMRFTHCGETSKMDHQEKVHRFQQHLFQKPAEEENTVDV